MFAKLTLATLLMAICSTAQASNPPSFVYQGRLMESNGLPTTGSVTLKLQIYNPGKNCLLYEEAQTVDLTGTDGLFTVAVGSVTGSAKRTANDPALSMPALFSNRNTVVRAPGTNCAAGYTPSNADLRYLRVTVTQGGTVDQLSPDQVLSSVPFATTAETLQGKQPGDFIQLRTDAGYSLNQSNMESVFSTSNFNKLVALLNGSGPTDLGGQRLTSVGNPVANNDAVNKAYSDTRVAGAVVAGGLTTGQVLSYDTVTQQWIPTDLPASARNPAATCAAGQASRWDGSAWSCITASGGGGGTATISTDNFTTVLTNVSPKIQVVSLATAGAVKLPAANTYAQTGGPIFHFLNTSGIDVPILNASGKLVARLPAAGGADVFLIDNSTVAGSWGSTSPTIGTATTKIANVALTPDSFSNGFIQAVRLSASAHLMSYDVDGGAGSTNSRIRVAQVNEGTESVTFGTPVTMLSNIQPQQIKLLTISSSSALGVGVNSMNEVQFMPLSVSGSVVTPGTQTTGPASCQLYTFRTDREAAYCHDYSSTTHRFLGNGTFQSVSGFADYFPFGSQSGITLMGKCGMSGLEVKAVDFPNGTVVGTELISGTASCNFEWSATGNGNYVYLPDGTGKVWVLFRINGSAYKTKISWSGSVIVTDVPPAPVGPSYGAMVLSVDGSNFLLAAGSGISGTKAEITTASSLAVGNLGPYSECYGPYIAGPDRCIQYQMLTATSAAANFKITR